jgi:putative FmdB family regulatory protein
MIRRYDFKCIDCDYIQEQWVDHLIKSTTCSECGHTAQRIISPVFTKFEGFGFPGADDKWARDHERAAKTN